MIQILSTFDVYDIVKFKFETPKNDTHHVYEVLELQIQKCYGGVQVFCLCRPIQMQLRREEPFKEDSPLKWVIGHGYGKDDNATGWRKFREDELIPVSDDIKSILESL